MKPHPRIRKAIKWGGAAMTVLLVVVWIGSGRMFAVSPKWGGWWISGGLGCVYVCREDSHFSAFDEHDSYWIWNPPFEFRWGFNVQWGTSWRNDLDRVLGIPLWALAGVSLAPTIMAWRLDTIARRRARVNLCPKCNYDRAGLAVGAKCPECGSLPA